MTFTEKYIDRFVYEKDKLLPDELRKGRFFIFSVFIIIILMIATTPILIISVPGEAVFTLIFNAFIVALLVTILFFFRKFGKRILWANILAAMLMLPFYETYLKTGGIYSSDNLPVLIIACWVFLVAGKKSGIVWFIASFTWWMSLFFFEQNHTRDFLADFIKMPASYHLFNYSSAGLFMAIIMFAYEQGKEKYLKELTKGKEEIEEQKKVLELQNEDIVSSINYAKKIQYAVLPNEDSIYRSIPLSFIYYKPRDIVSGDFFWFREIDRDNYIIVSADCTGHGVPGAFMTVIGSNLLTQIVRDNKTTKPSEILFELDKRITETLKQDKTRTVQIQDGMDLSLLKVDKSKKEFTYTSAKRPAIFIREKNIEEFKGSKLSLGGMRSGEKKFDEIKKNYEEDDMIYLFTDGYTDQFGGTDNKKFMIKRFRELLLSVCDLSMAEQKQKIDKTISDWIGTNEQTDDMQVIGIRF